MSGFNDLSLVGTILFYVLAGALPIILIVLVLYVLGSVSQVALTNLVAIFFPQNVDQKAEFFLSVLSEFFVGFFSCAVFPLAIFLVIVDDVEVSLPRKFGSWLAISFYVAAIYSPVHFIQLLTLGRGCGWEMFNC